MIPSPFIPDQTALQLLPASLSESWLITEAPKPWYSTAENSTALRLHWKESTTQFTIHTHLPIENLAMPPLQSRKSDFLRRVSRLEDYINFRRRRLQENWQSQSTKCAVQLLEHCSSTFYIPFIVLCLTWWLTCTPLAQAIDSPKANCKMCYVMNFTHRASCVTSPALHTTYKTEYGRAFILLLTINT